MRFYSFEKLEVYKLARLFAVTVYKVAGRLPESQKYGLKSQLERAAVSVVLNIAEGSSRQTAKEKATYIKYAYGSLLEILAAVQLSVDLKFLKPEAESFVREQIEPLTAMLTGLKNSFFENNIEVQESGEAYVTTDYRVKNHTKGIHPIDFDEFYDSLQN